MKRARIINAIVWILLFVATASSVCKVWNTNGCPVESIILGIGWYLACSLGLWFTLDQFIKGE